MHELGTVFYVIKEVEKLCDENDLTKVGSVTLQIGEVSGMKEAELKVEKLEAVTFCEDCKQTYPTVKYAKVCPYCQSENTYLVTGNEYIIKEIEAM